MPDKVRPLYERCWGCKGTRKLTIQMNKNTGGTLNVGDPCPLCQDGYYETGLSLGQFENKMTQLDLFMLALADLYGATCVNPDVAHAAELDGMRGQASDLLQRYAARIQDARNRLDRPGWVPPFKPHAPE